MVSAEPEELADPFQTSRIRSIIDSNALPRESEVDARRPRSRPRGRRRRARATTRPSEIFCSDAVCLASSVAFSRQGTIMIVVASRILSVTAAAAASAISGSRLG